MLHVIGAGLARTGTTSTKGALEELGFSPCYTYFTMFSRPADADHWLAAYAGEKVDWAAFFSEFQAVVDWPACDFLEPLMALYPEAKIVLTVRDAEKWYLSMKNTIWAVYDAQKRGGGPVPSNMMRLNEIMMWDGAFEGKFLDKDFAIGFFERHNAKIKATIPKEKLLVFDVKEGWEPLCGFLGMPVPDHPFPNLNDTQAFNDRVQMMQAQHAGAR
jgi:hypothetical protein